MSIYGGPDLGKERRPLTRADVEERLRQAGSSDKLSLEGEDLHGSDLSSISLCEVNLRDANLSGANLSGANLSGAKLVGTNLVGTNLNRADLSDADLSDANLSRANLIRADLIRADLSRANLSDANLIGANLGGADLSRADLSRASLSDAKLLGAKLIGVKLSDANLSGAKLSGAKLSRADLSRADLSRADLSRADLSGANLSRASLIGADLSGANLANVIVSSYSMWPQGLPYAFSPLLSSPLEIITGSVLRLRIVEESLTTQHLLTTLETLLSLYVKVWLVEHGRLEDMLRYTRERDRVLESEAPLPIAALTYNSPANIKFNLDISPKGVVDALQNLVEIITHARLRKQAAEEALRTQRIENDRQEEALKQERLTTLNQAFGTVEQGIALVEKLSPHLNCEEQVSILHSLAADILHLASDSTLEFSLERPPSPPPLQVQIADTPTKTTP